MAGDFGAKVLGLPDLRAALAGIVPKLRVRALRIALAAGGRVVRDHARRHAPVLRGSTHNRQPGTVRKAITVRTSKLARREGNVGVFINVKPLPGAKYKTTKGPLGGKRRVMVRASQRGANNPRDPFYWKFLEFGTKKMRAMRFLKGAAGKLGEALNVFKAKIGPAINKLNNGKGAQP